MEILKHECGVAMIRLLKSGQYYKEKYNTKVYGLEKLYLMMEKQHNRGQEGAGIASVHLDAKPTSEYMFRERAEGKDAISEIFSRVGEEFQGELLMGHLRYSTTGRKGIKFVHPFLRRSAFRASNLCICGNFNMTNIDEVFASIAADGLYPRSNNDSHVMLEMLGNALDAEVSREFSKANAKDIFKADAAAYVDDNIDISAVLSQAMPKFDGGYVVCGITGSGDMFAVRDPWGIRPAYYYADEEIVALASERPVIQTSFDLQSDSVKELEPGCALIIRRCGRVLVKRIMPAASDSEGRPLKSACSFERIYFSRGNDCDIYRERKKLGEQLAPAIEKAVDGDVSDTVFSYIPNTAEVAYYGMLQGLMSRGHNVRFEKIAWKDIKMRTFIAEGESRNHLAGHVYDITYGVIRPGKDNLAIIDDSIVRGTTLKESIIKILDRLHPNKIVIISSAPQIRYPDYYGIDMPHLEELIAFRACIALIHESGHTELIKEAYARSLAHIKSGEPCLEPAAKMLYKPFSVSQINQKMVELLMPDNVKTPVELVFQSVEGLHAACPDFSGDWYFTGDYPTAGGAMLCDRALVSYIEKNVSLLQ